MAASRADLGSLRPDAESAMKKPPEDRRRDERIRNEVIVDAYGPQEQAMGWYYYLDGKMRFPFQGRCAVTRTVSPLRKGETVEVRRMAPEETCSSDMLVLIRWEGRSLAVPLFQLAAIAPDKAISEALSAWHY
jgi:hypothetical protein